MASSSASLDSDASANRLLIDRRNKKRKRDANVYDAVAGRVTTTHALDDAPGPETPYQKHQRTTLRDPTLAPEEVLFRRAAAPVRYAEKDIYHAHDRLPRGGQDVLPDSDMLKAIHSYSSHFYAALAAPNIPPAFLAGGTKGQQRRGQKNVDERSMDETALLAFGILLEEAGRESLGRSGDLVFTEGVDEDDPESEPVGFLDALPGQSRSRRRGGPSMANKGASE